MSERVKAKTMKRRNIKGLELSAAPVATAPSPSAGDAQIPGAIGNNGRADTLEIGVEFKLDLRSEDLVVVKELGAGNGGTVSKVFHPATKVIMAKKVSRREDVGSRGGSFDAERHPGHPRRSQEGGPSQTDCPGAAHHARLQLAVHRLLLRRLPQQRRRCDHVHGVHGLRVWPTASRSGSVLL